MGTGFLGIAELGHADHAQKNGAGHLRPFDSHGSTVGEVVDEQCILRGEGRDIAVLVVGVDDLQHPYGIASENF